MAWISSCVLLISRYPFSSAPSCSEDVGFCMKVGSIDWSLVDHTGNSSIINQKMMQACTFEKLKLDETAGICTSSRRNMQILLRACITGLQPRPSADHVAMQRFTRRPACQSVTLVEAQTENRQHACARPTLSSTSSALTEQSQGYLPQGIPP